MVLWMERGQCPVSLCLQLKCLASSEATQKLDLFSDMGLSVRRCFISDHDGDHESQRQGVDVLWGRSSRPPPSPFKLSRLEVHFDVNRQNTLIL